MAGEPAVPTIAANSAVIHHVSLPVRDVGRSVAFYEDVLGLRRIERPDLHRRDAALQQVFRQSVGAVHEAVEILERDLVSFPGRRV